MTADSLLEVLDLSKWISTYEAIELPPGRSVELARRHAPVADTDAVEMLRAGLSQVHY